MNVSERRRLLLVDDEPMLLSAMARLLRRSGYEVDVAADGREALAHLAGNECDLVITDVRMPVLDGKGLLRQMSDDHRTIPVIVLTGYGDASDSELRALGACAVLGKPTELGTLKAAIARCLAPAKGP